MEDKAFALTGIFVMKPFLVSLAGALVTGALLRQLRASSVLVPIFSLIGGIAALALTALLVIYQDPQQAMMLAFGFPFALFASIAGSALGAVAHGMALGRKKDKPASSQTPNGQNPQVRISKPEISPLLFLGVFLCPLLFALPALRRKMKPELRWAVALWLGIAALIVAAPWVTALRLRLGDPRACPQGDAKCWAGISLLKGDPTLCYGYKNEAGKKAPKECGANFAQLAQTPAQCAALAEAAFSAEADLCFDRFPPGEWHAQACASARAAGNEGSFTRKGCWTAANHMQPFPGKKHQALHALLSLETIPEGELERILAFHPELNSPAEGGLTPLHFLRHPSALAPLLKAGANPSLSDQAGRTAPMRWAEDWRLQLFSEENLQALHEAGWNPNATDAKGNSLLHLLPSAKLLKSKQGKIIPMERERVDALIRAGANPELPNEAGLTPREIARQRNIPDMFP